jgi:hypothetical protein
LPNAAAYFFIVPSVSRSVRFVSTVISPETFDGSAGEDASSDDPGPPRPQPAATSAAASSTPPNARLFTFAIAVSRCVARMLGNVHH